MTISTMDEVVAALSAGQNRTFMLQSVTTVANRFTLLNAASAQNQWGQMATPTARGSGGAIITDATAGFMPWTAAGGGAQDYLMLLNASGGTAMTLNVYDVVYAVSGFSGTSAVAQTITSMPSIPRPANGDGLEMFAVIWTQIGTTGTTVTASYTNQAGTASRTTIAASIGATGLREVYRLIPMPLQAGDTGVQAIASATLAGTTGTAGDWGLVLARFICEVPVYINANPPIDFAGLGMPALDSDTAFGFFCFASTTVSGFLSGSLRIGAG